jgi:hypothetical protein
LRLPLNEKRVYKSSTPRCEELKAKHTSFTLRHGSFNGLFKQEKKTRQTKTLSGKIATQYNRKSVSLTTIC